MIDAISMGNKTRFINHGKYRFMNCDVKIFLVNGALKIGFFALKDIGKFEVFYKI